MSPEAVRWRAAQIRSAIDRELGAHSEFEVFTHVKTEALSEEVADSWRVLTLEMADEDRDLEAR